MREHVINNPVKAAMDILAVWATVKYCWNNMYLHPSSNTSSKKCAEKLFHGSFRIVSWKKNDLDENWFNYSICTHSTILESHSGTLCIGLRLCKFQCLLVCKLTFPHIYLSVVYWTTLQWLRLYSIKWQDNELESILMEADMP